MEFNDNYWWIASFDWYGKLSIHEIILQYSPYDDCVVYANQSSWQFRVDKIVEYNGSEPLSYGIVFNASGIYVCYCIGKRGTTIGVYENEWNADEKLLGCSLFIQFYYVSFHDYYFLLIRSVLLRIAVFHLNIFLYSYNNFYWMGNRSNCIRILLLNFS